MDNNSIAHTKWNCTYYADMSFCAARDMRLLDLACPKARKIP